MALTAKKVYAILKRQISDMEAKLNSPVRYRGTVATADLLPLTPDIGDMYNIESKSVYGEAGMNVAWNGVVWDTMGAPIDMSLYLTKEEAEAVIQRLVTEYFEKNPVKPGATTEQAQQIEHNKTDIASLKTETSSLKEDLGEVITPLIVTKQANDFSIALDAGDKLVYGISVPTYNGTYSVFGYTENNSLISIRNNCEPEEVYTTVVENKIVRVRIYLNSAIPAALNGIKILTSTLGFNISSFALKSYMEITNFKSLSDNIKFLGKNDTVEFKNSGKNNQVVISIDAGETIYFKLLSYSGKNLLSATVTVMFDDNTNFTIVEGVHLGYIGKFTATKHVKKIQFYYNVSANENCDKSVLLNIEKDTICNDLFSLKDKTKNLSTSFNVLILGDSYSATGAWVRTFRRMIDCSSLLNLGVSSATLRDKYADREMYPYTDAPNANETTGNKNTFMCQVQKLKKMVSNGDYTSVPDIIFIQGGTNDTKEVVETDYMTTLYEQKLAYVTIGTSTKRENMYVKKKIDSLDRTKFLGAMASLYSEVHAMYPNALILFIAPSGLSYPGGNNIDAKEKTEQIKNAARCIGCPVCEWADVGFGYYGNIYTGDGTQSNPYVLADDNLAADWLHPNDKFGEILAKRLLCTLNEYIPVL